MELDPSGLAYLDAYKLLIGAVLPRPIAFVSTLSVEGVPNLSPFAFYNVVSSQPPILVVSVGRRPDGRRKDTAENAIATGGNGTPWSIIISKSGKAYPFAGAQPHAAVKKLIDTALQEK